MPDYQTLAPGVYIDEIEPTGPIAGVGTSVAGFVGTAATGDVNAATRVTNWTQFLERFGPPVRTGWLAPAVRGFFANGGTEAWVVRAGTATRARRELPDRGQPARTTLAVRARAFGAAGNAITVRVTAASLVPQDRAVPAVAARAEAGLSSSTGRVVTLADADDAALFRPGDVVTIDGTTRATVQRVDGDRLHLDAALPDATTGRVRIADLRTGQRAFRVQHGGGIEPGSVLHLSQGADDEDVVVDAVDGERVTLAGPGLTRGYSLTQAAEPVTIESREFTLEIGGPTQDGPFVGLSMDRRHSRYVHRAVRSALVEVLPPEPRSVQLPPADLPATMRAPAQLEGGQDDTVAPTAAHFTAALAALERVRDVSIVCVPGVVDQEVQQAVVASCARLADRFAVLDAPEGAALDGDDGVLAHRAALESAGGYAAVYHPWILIADPSDPRSRELVAAPPSGHVAGIFARSDSARGVHKAPANEVVEGARDLRHLLDDAEHGALNRAGVNALRVFPGRSRPVVWGARTTAPTEATAWRYVNVRRLLLYIEESLQEGLRWVVFEPNETGLWKRVDRTVTEFLTRVWRSGALFGVTAQQAFYVKIDEENNPPDVRDLGQLNVEVGVAPVRPAEFVVVRIGLWSGPDTGA